MIYFIANEEQGIVKIGHTAENVKNRLNNIQVGNPFMLNIIGTMNGDIALERELHKKFKQFRMEGEWFIYNNDIKDFISKMNELSLCNYEYNTYYKAKSPRINKKTYRKVKLNIEFSEDIKYTTYGRILHLITMTNNKNMVVHSNGKPIDRKELTLRLGFDHPNSLDKFINILKKHNIIYKKKIDNKFYYILNKDYVDIL